MMKPKFSTLAAALCFAFASSISFALPLQTILRTVLQNDPQVLEARANEKAAQSSVKEANAGHYPLVSVGGSQTLLYNSDTNQNPSRFNPSINTNLNLYAWGGIESEVKQNQHKADYYHHKITETQEELGGTVGKLYLGALRAKELISVAQSNIARHNRIVADLRIITQHDKGRQSELDQALDRQLRAQSHLIELTHQLESNLSRLGKYTGSMLSPADLEDPFVRETQQALIQQYRNGDLSTLPSYMAQQSEKDSVIQEVEVAKAKRFPRINLVGTANRDNRQVYVNLAWDFYNPAAKYNVERTAHTLTVAETKMDQILRDVAERSRNAQIDMVQYLQRYQLAQRQIVSQQGVVKAYELQFKIARRNLIDVLDSYADLANMEHAAVTAQNNYRDAALEYLVSQAAVGQWIGFMPAPEQNTENVVDKPAVLHTEKVEQPTKVALNEKTPEPNNANPTPEQPAVVESPETIAEPPKPSPTLPEEKAKPVESIKPVESKGTKLLDSEDTPPQLSENKVAKPNKKAAAPKAAKKPKPVPETPKQPETPIPITESRGTKLLE